MGIKIRVTNKLPKVEKELEQEFEDAITRATLIVHGNLMRVLSGQRSGKRYRVPGTKRYYFASKPGESPASRLGILRTSYAWLINNKGIKARGYVGSPLLYALWLEKGTKKMAKRPHLRKAFEMSRVPVREQFVRFL